MGVKEKNVCVFLRKIYQETAFLFEPKEFMSLNNLTCRHSITWLSYSEETPEICYLNGQQAKGKFTELLAGW